MDTNSLSLALFDKLSNARDALSFSPLLSGNEDDSQLQNVSSSKVAVECALDVNDPESSAANLQAQFDELLSNPESELARIALNSRVTNAGVTVSEDDEILRATVQVFYHYCELEPVGEIIDGDLVIQGMSIRDNFGPAFCTIEHAPSMGDDYTEIGVVAPWSFMLTASEGDTTAGDVAHKASQFMIPVSIPAGFESGIVRLRIFVDELNKIPYDEEPLNENGECTYDMVSAEKRGTLVCAVSVVKHLSSDQSGAKVEGAGLDGTAVEGGGTPVGEEGATGSAKGSRRDSEGSAASAHNKADVSTAGVESARDGSQAGTGAAADPNAGEDDIEVLSILAGEKEDTFDSERVPSQPLTSSSRPHTANTASSYAADALILEQTQGVITDIRIASDYDDVLALQSEGYELHCTAVTPEGPLSEQEHLWRFHVMAKYGDGSEKTGLEDVAWVKCLKSLGTLPIVPLFQILHDYDLSDDEDDYAIYLAYKVGPNPKFKRVVMLSSTIEDERHLTHYINAFTAVFRPAPAPVAKAVGGPCGIFLMVDAHPVREPSAPGSEGKTRKTSTRDSPKTRSHSHSYDGDHSRASSPGGASHSSRNEESEVDEESEDEEEDNEEEQIAAMMQRIEELQAEKTGLQGLNSELQKKAVALIAREKAMQGQTAAARTAAEVVANSAAENPEAAQEHNAEREKQYQDTLLQIVDERAKLNKQLKEFDQLALDLQTRLDDKELKANSIQSSFKQFKKEILSKAENSRTGQAIPPKQIAHFEASEQKHEEDLERVRLRNISLRTTYRKLERTLRAREQLAEGLHMIDFEQLKIENQTLNEKIEERNEDLAKLKRKKTTTVQVLTHIREKLRFVEQANEQLSLRLAHLENVTTELRNIVTSEKLYRDELRAENKELRAKQGFATSDLLLVDYESRCAKVDQLKAATTELKDRYAILVRQVNKSIKSSSSTPWVASQSHTMK